MVSLEVDIGKAYKNEIVTDITHIKHYWFRQYRSGRNSSHIRTASALGTYAVTVITAITVQDSNGIINLHFLPSGLVVEQTKAIISDLHPRAVKIGMLGDECLCRKLRDEVIGCSMPSGKKFRWHKDCC